PVRRLVVKLGADTSIVYKPSGRPVTEKWPSASVVAGRAEPPDWFFTDTAAYEIGFPATSRTVPATVAVASDCASSPTGAAAHKSTHKAAAHARRRRFNTSSRIVETSRTEIRPNGLI